jgi:hypothetical protein
MALDLARDDRLQHVVQPAEGIEIIEFGGVQQGGEDGPGFRAAVIAGEETVLSIMRISA